MKPKRESIAEQLSALAGRLRSLIMTPRNSMDRESPNVHHGAMGYPTPEEAVLAEWESYPQAAVRIIKVRHKGKKHAVVVTDTMPSHPMWNYCERTSDGWEFTHDHN